MMRKFTPEFVKRNKVTDTITGFEKWNICDNLSKTRTIREGKTHTK